MRPGDVLSCQIVEMGVHPREALILAIMTQEGIKVVHKTMVNEAKVEYGEIDDQTLVLITGVAIARQRGWLK